MDNIMSPPPASALAHDKIKYGFYSQRHCVHVDCLKWSNHSNRLKNGEEMGSLPAQEPAAALTPLLSFVAISELNKGDETLQQIVLQTVACLPSERFEDAQDVAKALNTLFGLEVNSERLRPVVEGLLKSEVLKRGVGGELQLSEARRKKIEGRINAAKGLEEKVQFQWEKLCSEKYPSLDSKKSFLCLQDYLFRLFRRHGMQTVALLDSNIGRTKDHLNLLSANLAEVVKSKCADGDRAKTETAINEFLATVGTDEERTAYIVQLADGAFNYFALSAPPEIAKNLQAKLQELVLFLDTNFLFGVFGLDTNPLVAVSQELIRIIDEHKLPFKLRYHEITDTEMRRTVGALATSIKSRHWTSELSRAAAESPYVSGIERHFHEENAKGSVDPEVFFKPYLHFDILLRDRGVLIYRGTAPRTSERAELINRYSEYLRKRDREKPYEAVDHDMTLLDCVQQLRSDARSSLEARSLIITCDAMLNKFDWHETRENRSLPCSILPNHFLQLLRPYLPAGADFDKSFAETFAIPEFRAISGGYHLAASKLLSLLATYKNLKSETAAALLANTMLLDRIRETKTAEQAQQLVENAIATANTQLLEERVALLKEAKEARNLKSTLADTSAQLSSVSLHRDEIAQKHVQTNVVLQTVRNENFELREMLRESEHRIATANDARVQTDLRIAELEKKLGQIESAATEARGSADNARTVASLVIAAALIGVWEWALHSLRFGAIVLNHTNAYSIRCLVALLILTLSVGLARPKWRNLLWVTLGTTIAIALVSVLGGPHS